MNAKRNILVTGGAGFIGSHLVRLLVSKYPNYRIVNLDALTYAGNLSNLRDIEARENYIFVRGDICDPITVSTLFSEYKIDGVIHLAAETHVDRSIEDPTAFARTNVMGTIQLLEAARNAWEPCGWKVESEDGTLIDCLFCHISTDEVYGALSLTLPSQDIDKSNGGCGRVCSEGKGSVGGEENRRAYGEGLFTEDSKYAPHSPYSASKASSDHFARAFHDTYGMPVIVTNCSNNYGPYQFPEKLIPLTINNVRLRKPVPVYGRGENVRDWLYVEDHVRAIDLVFHNGRVGETYNIGGCSERRNIDVVKTVIQSAARLLGRAEDEALSLIDYVTDRKGHDLRYAIDCSKIMNELGWKPEHCFEDGIEKTVKWYLDNPNWLDNVVSGDYLTYYEKMYGDRK